MKLKEFLHPLRAKIIPINGKTPLKCSLVHSFNSTQLSSCENDYLTQKDERPNIIHIGNMCHVQEHANIVSSLQTINLCLCEKLSNLTGICEPNEEWIILTN